MASFGYIGLSVADFYAQLGDALRGLGIEIAIRPVPYDTFTTIPFADDRQHIADNSEYMQRFGRVLCAVWPVFEIFRGRYYGKSSPVHLFWHSFDIAVTRFSGRPAALEKGNAVAREAYSHEAISFGFWPGDTNFPEAAFYSYTYPDPPDIGMQRLSTDQAFWDDSRGSHLALLKYSEVSSSRDPAAMLLEFFESAYLAGRRAAGWDTTL